MPKRYDPPGLNHYVDAEAAELLLQDGPDNHHPVAAAYRVDPLQRIAAVVTTAADNDHDPATVQATLAHGEDQLAAILLAYRAGVAMLIDAHDGLETKVPTWLKVHAYAADPASKATGVRTITEEARVRDLTTQLATQGIVPPSTTERPFLQDENPYPPPDPSPFHLENPHLDPRNHPRPPGHEVETPEEPNPESLPGPRQLADGKPGRGRGKVKPRPEGVSEAGITADPTEPTQPQLPAPVIGAPPAHDVGIASGTVPSSEATPDAPQPPSPGSEGSSPGTPAPDPDEPGPGPNPPQAG